MDVDIIKKTGYLIFGSLHYSWGVWCQLRASPRVWQIELASLIFGKNIKNTPPTVWQKTWQFLATWKKTSLQRVNIRVQRVVGIVVSSQMGG